MRAGEAGALFCLFFGLLTIYFSQKLGLGGLKSPGPGFMTFWAGVILAAFSLIIFRGSRSADKGADGKRLTELWTGFNWAKGAWITASLIVYSLIFSRAGFLVSTMLLLIILLKAIEPVRWWVAIVLSFTTTFISFAIFFLWLKVQLPCGAIEAFLLG